MPARYLGLWGPCLQRHGNNHAATISASEQQELPAQTMAGIMSVLDEQGAELIGGHTMESRSTSPVPASLGVQITLTVNGNSPKSPWLKTGICPGDAPLIVAHSAPGCYLPGP